MHQAVLLQEVLQYLNPLPGQNFIDCTFGAGGHSQAILEKIGPEGHLIALDQDANTENKARELQKKYQNFEWLHGNFRNLLKIIVNNQLSIVNSQCRISGILLDLGFSSDQLEDPERGFSWRLSGPLDMRMNPSEEIITATELIQQTHEDDLANIIYNFGEERQSRKIAKSIKQQKPQTTQDLKKAIDDAVHGTRPKVLSRVFQALRIAVNHELEILHDSLKQAFEILDQGRLCVISFHSLEDRVVKQFMKQKATQLSQPIQSDQGTITAKILTKKVVRASRDEMKQNPRATSAKLRCLEKIIEK